METAWALRWKTPRSSASRTKTSSRKPSVERPVLREREERHVGVHRALKRRSLAETAALFPLTARARAAASVPAASRAAFPSLSRKGAVPMTSRTIVLPLGFGLSRRSLVSRRRADGARPRREPPAGARLHERRPRPRPAVPRRDRRPLGPGRLRRGAAARRRRPTTTARARAARRTGARRRAACASASRPSRRRPTSCGRGSPREDDERQHCSRAQPRASSRSRAASGDADPVARARLAAIELRMRALEDDLAERARRDGALPGWLR